MTARFTFPKARQIGPFLAFLLNFCLLKKKHKNVECDFFCDFQTPCFFEEVYLLSKLAYTVLSFGEIWSNLSPKFISSVHLTERFTLKIEVLLSSLKGFSAEKDLWTDGTQSFKSHLNFQAHSRCLKITKKSHLIESEASYVLFWVDKNSLKMPKNGQFWRVFST